ncbi:Transcription elongation factor A protein 2 [Durusdinium trenchii]|uniref:Transcription elongation factor A protein 2 n=1 Tax=Durusdinium trenchii TaxID=1381693 RepID=A0ABP0RM30_9DINO
MMLAFEYCLNQNAWVAAYFAGLDIGADDAGTIFTLMDTNNSGDITVDEFVKGTMKLKGHAKSIDIFAIMFDITRMALTVQKLCSFVEDSFRDIKRSLDQPGLTVGGQGSPSPPLWELYVHTTQENSLMHGPERSVVFERSCLLFLGLRALTTLEPEECVIYIRPCIYIYPEDP